LRFTKVTSIDSAHDAEDRLFVMFHGYGNDEYEMIRIMAAIDPEADYISFRGVVERPYLGGDAWYGKDDTDEEIQRQCSAIGDEVVDMLDSTALHNKRVIPIGFSQGGYLAYRLFAEHPEVFDTAVLLSPAFHDPSDADDPDAPSVEESMVLEDVTDSKPKVFLGYGDLDTEVSPERRQRMRHALSTFADLSDKVYEGMRHDVCDKEFADIRRFLQN
jgi:phospholipase/carboxylesterase